MTEVAEPVQNSTDNPPLLAPADEPLGVPPWLWITVALVAVLAVGLTVQNGFIHTDHALIANNSMLWNGQGLLLIWTSIYPTPAAYQFDYYAPVSWSLLSFEWRVFGNWAGGYHVVSLILHALTSLMIVQLLRKLAVRGAGLAGLLFAAHPVLLGATGWLSMQPLVLGTFLSLAALYVMLRWMKLTQQTLDALPTESNRLFILMIVLVVAASLAHPIGGLVPLAALLISWWKRGTVESQQMSSLAPIVLLGVVVVWLFVYMQIKLLSSATLAELDFGTTPLAELFARLKIASYSMLFHAFHLVIPYRLSFDYGWSSPGILTLVSLGVVVALVGTLIAQSQKFGRGALAAVGLYALLLLPFLGIFNIERLRYTLVRDGEVYAAAIPFFALIVALLVRIVKSEKYVTLVVALAAAVFLGLSFARAEAFKNDDVLWSKTLTRHPNSLLAELELAQAIQAEFKQEKIANADDLVKIRSHIDRALAINPKNLDARILDAIYPPDYKIATSIQEIGKIVNAYPTYPPATFAAAQQFEIAARFYEEGGKDKEYGLAIGQAFEFFSDTARNDPGNIAARVKVGQLLIRAALTTPDPKSSLEKKQQGVMVLQQAVDLNPNRIETRLAFAKALYDVGMVATPEDREAIFARAVENLYAVEAFDPGNAEASFYAGLMHQQSGFTEQALMAFLHAHEKRPEWTAPLFGMAEVYLNRKEFDKAREWLDKAIKIEPENPFFAKLAARIESAATQPSTDGPTTMPTTVPATTTENVEERSQFTPEYKLKLTDTGVEWSVRVNTGGWTMKTDHVLVEEINQKSTAQIFLILEQPGDDEMVTQAFETLSARHDAPNLQAAELLVKRVIRGDDSTSASTYAIVKRAP